eukprot:scaffold66746_cov18-Tisochrysis_lutea.AAC.1
MMRAMIYAMMCAITQAAFVRVNPDWNQLARDLPIAGATATKEVCTGSMFRCLAGSAPLNKTQQPCIRMPCLLSLGSECCGKQCLSGWPVAMTAAQCLSRARDLN